MVLVKLGKIDEQFFIREMRISKAVGVLICMVERLVGLANAISPPIVRDGVVSPYSILALH